MKTFKEFIIEGKKKKSKHNPYKNYKKVKMPNGNVDWVMKKSKSKQYTM